MKTEVEQAIAAVKDAMKGEDAQRIRQSTERLSQVSQRLTEALRPAEPPTGRPSRLQVPVRRASPTWSMPNSRRSTSATAKPPDWICGSSPRVMVTPGDEHAGHAAQHRRQLRFVATPRSRRRRNGRFSPRITRRCANRLLRALADAEKHAARSFAWRRSRRHAAGEAEDARKFAIADFARELLLVVDNLERTIEAAEGQSSASAESAAFIEGVRATLRILLQTLERFGVRRIEALGQPFDPNLHEAIMEVEDPSQPTGTVVRVVEQGYTIHDRLLRPARVIVAKRRDGDKSAPDTEKSRSEWCSFKRSPTMTSALSLAG